MLAIMFVKSTKELKKAINTLTFVDMNVSFVCTCDDKSENITTNIHAIQIRMSVSANTIHIHSNNTNANNNNNK